MMNFGTKLFFSKTEPTWELLLDMTLNYVQKAVKMSKIDGKVESQLKYTAVWFKVAKNPILHALAISINFNHPDSAEVCPSELPDFDRFMTIYSQRHHLTWGLDV